MAAKRKKFIADLLTKSITELREMLTKAQKELFFLKMKNKVRALQQTHLLQVKRKEVARVQTVLTSKIKESHGSIGG